MVTPAKQQMPHVPAGGDEANFHALVTSPTAKSRDLLCAFMKQARSIPEVVKNINVSKEHAKALADAIEDFLR